jgi:hypothetical protein
LTSFLQTDRGGGSRTAAMNHLKLFACIAFTCVLAAIANATVARNFGFDLYALKLELIAPAGAAILGFVAASGALFAARFFKAAPEWSDALPLLTIAAATVLLIHSLDGSTLKLEDAYQATGQIDFRSYIGLLLARTQTGAQVDEGQFYLAALEFLGFVAGAGMCLSLISVRPAKTCALCAAAVRKVRSATSPVLSFHETTGVLELFETGDSKVMQKLLRWRPEEKSFGPKSERATVTYDLYVCPKCKSEEVAVSVQAFKGKRWNEVPSLSARRIFAEDLSLQDAFR